MHPFWWLLFQSPRILTSHILSDGGEGGQGEEKNTQGTAFLNHRVACLCHLHLLPVPELRFFKVQLCVMPGQPGSGCVGPTGHCRLFTRPAVEPPGCRPFSLFSVSEKHGEEGVSSWHPSHQSQRRCHPSSVSTWCEITENSRSEKWQKEQIR